MQSITTAPALTAVLLSAVSVNAISTVAGGYRAFGDACDYALGLDFDRDGLLDLYVAGYFDERHDLWNLASTRIMQSSFEFATNGAVRRRGTASIGFPRGFTVTLDLEQGRLIEKL